MAEIRKQTNIASVIAKATEGNVGCAHQDVSIEGIPLVSVDDSFPDIAFMISIIANGACKPV